MTTQQHPDQWPRLKIAAISDAGREDAEFRAREFLSTYGLFNAYSKLEDYSRTVFLDNGNILLDPEVFVMTREEQIGLPFLECENERINLGPRGTGLIWTGSFSPLHVQANNIEGSLFNFSGGLSSLERTALGGTYFPRLAINREERQDVMYGHSFDGLTLRYASKEKLVLRTSSGDLIDIPR